MQPQVKLSYSSRSGNGLAGMGWSLSAGASISRCGQTAAQDGRQLGAYYSATDDRLCFNGQRLWVVNGKTYGTTGAEYRTELDTFARITQVGEINGKETYFRVDYKNNRYAFLGQGSAAHKLSGRDEIHRWKLSQEFDRAGNYMTYHYNKDITPGKGEHLLTKITYTGFGDQEGDREVRFVYKDRSDFSSQYAAGGQSQSTQILSSIQTWYDDNKVREFMEYANITS